MSYRLKRDTFGARAGSPVTKDRDGNYWIEAGPSNSIEISKHLPYFLTHSESHWLTKETSEVYCLDRNEIIETLSTVIVHNPSLSAQGIIQEFLRFALSFRGTFTMPHVPEVPIDTESTH
jgi:hypothetical protein